MLKAAKQIGGRAGIPIQTPWLQSPCSYPPCCGHRSEVEGFPEEVTSQLALGEEMYLPQTHGREHRARSMGEDMKVCSRMCLRIIHNVVWLKCRERGGNAGWRGGLRCWRDWTTPGGGAVFIRKP